ncbi:unnamed protein product [Psylliodes chrysocephalus]|uniref:Uncharacterized protein n=1 Tax=Psylliodes chrysocephalus TaxID=3402493 RepID=A0A9P0GAN3_9CUCU|nr:unnamed protein product [Psylliodes chrysocephala]
MIENDEQQIINEPTIIEAKSESDAVHPRFIKENPEEILKYEQEHYYYCIQCQLYFAPTFEGLSIHYDKEIISHKPLGSCFYCKGKVYEYTKQGESKLYHNCRNKTENHEQ